VIARIETGPISRSVPAGVDNTREKIPAELGSAFVTLALATLLAACTGDVRPARSVELSECRLPKLPTAAQCGTIEVPEDRDKPDGRRIAIHFAVLPANTLSPRPDPLLLLPGGPGQSADALVPFASRLAEVRRTRDVVLVDPRGAGRSAPLDCAALKPEDEPDDVIEMQSSE